MLFIVYMLLFAFYKYISCSWDSRLFNSICSSNGNSALEHILLISRKICCCFSSYLLDLDYLSVLLYFWTTTIHSKKVQNPPGVTWETIVMCSLAIRSLSCPWFNNLFHWFSKLCPQFRSPFPQFAKPCAQFKKFVQTSC